MFTRTTQRFMSHHVTPAEQWELNLRDAEVMEVKKATKFVMVLAMLGGCDNAEDLGNRFDDVMRCPEAGEEVCGTEGGSTGGDSAPGEIEGGAVTEGETASETAADAGDDGCADGSCGETEDAEDGSDSGGDGDDGAADVPYNYDVTLGEEVSLMHAFLQEGPAPLEIVSVTMSEGGDWRLAELASGTPFIVTQEDCDHEGNRDIGSDRIELSWVNPDGSTASDHMTIRYCD